ncbi:MAG: MMPL family transporter, partial [Methylocystis sp.]|uniref:MMPL family transporter n=1 Tax=Methylocystis sp. TaxID=1911079 RepID=UPI003DA5B0CB
MKPTILQTGKLAITLWLAVMLTCAAIIARSHFTADLSAFLPRTPTAEQQLLMDQLRDGLASKLILIGIEGADEATRARLSKEMAYRLRNNPAFIDINNGEPVSAKRDRDYLFKNRYLLSPAVTPQRFSAEGLHAALSDSIDQLASPAGLLMKSLLPRDPTGEMLQLLEQMNGADKPQMINGAWASKDGKTALLLAQTHASGSDTDAQQQAMQAVRAAFAEVGASTGAQLLMTGPGVFSVLSRDAIKQQVRLIFIVSSVLIALLLLAVYRSFAALVLGFLPVATGILAGIAAVSLGFGVVHGITLGFGTALIGEAVDYSIYLFMQSEQGEADRKNWVARVWPTIRLGVLTSVFGFASLLFSGFPGLAQLGLYSIAGLLAAAAMTRYVLPHLLPAGFQVRDVSTMGARLSSLAKQAQRLRWAAVALLAVASAVLYIHRDNLWNHELAALSPVSTADQALDTRLRAGMGAPDVRYLVVVSGDSREAVLRSAEQVSLALQPLVEQGALAAFESPSRYLPSAAAQQARQASLPETAVLTSRLEQAAKDLPVRSQLFTPFLADVAAARSQPLLQRADLDGTAMAMAVDGLLIRQNNQWNALLPLTAPESGDINAALVRDALPKTLPSSGNALFVDLKAESNRLYSGYLHEAILLSLAGLAAIVALLFAVLRSPRRVAAVVLPLAAAVLTVTAGLALAGQQLIILHLIGLLLIVAIGSNYALFFDQRDATQALPPRTVASLLFANVATVLGFG